jgi:peptidyl-prolyl isomerase D
VRVADETGDPYEDFPEDQQPSEDYDWKGDEILKISTELKDMGNAAFKNTNLGLAVKKYQKALRYLHEYPAPVDGDPSDLFPKLCALKISVYTNCALVQNKMNLWTGAVESTTKALDIEGITDKDKAKAYFRRAQAKMSMRQEEDALSDLNQAIKFAPGDAAIVKELDAAKKRLAARKEKEKKAYKNAFNFD